MKATEETPQRPTPMRFFADLVLRNWGLKAIAFALAAFMFVFTRDEVTRVFTVPLRVIEDPDRVLMTELPTTIQVQARGPWTRVNRLQDYDFGVATLDLEIARPGPLEIDRGGIVMPPGVVLAGTKYDHVDLRFDPVIERDVVVKAQVEGEPAPDYELVGVEVKPKQMRIRGGESFVQRVQQLLIEPMDIEGADHDVESSRPLVLLPEGVALIGEGAEATTILVQAVINARSESRRYTVPVAIAPGLDPMGVVPRTYEVEVRGPRPDFRVLDALEVALPIAAEATEGETDDQGARRAEVRFFWAGSVPTDLRKRLSFDHDMERIMLPKPPPPPPTLDLPGPE